MTAAGHIGIVIRADGTVPFDPETEHDRQIAATGAGPTRAQVHQHIRQWLAENHPNHTLHRNDKGEVTHAVIEDWKPATP